MANESLIVLNDYEILQPENGWVGRVYNIKDINLKMNRGRSQYWAGGLYDPTIFGSPNKCMCYQNWTIKGSRCPGCRVKVVDMDTYLKSYATYKLDIPYVPFISYAALRNELIKVLPIPNKCQTNADFWSLYLKISDEDFDGATLLFNSEGKPKYVQLTELPSPEEFDETTSWQNGGLFGLVQLGDLYDADGIKLEKIRNLIHYQLIISSPGRRYPHEQGGLLTIPPETINYRAIISFAKVAFKDINEYPIVDAMTICASLNTMINRHYGDNELLQPSKQSLTRTIVDTRVSKSFRAGIVSKLYDDKGDPVPMDTIYVPRYLFYQAVQYDIINRLTDQLIAENMNLETAKEVVIEDAKQLYKKQDVRAIKISEELADTSMCILTRNPSLSKFSQFAFKIRLYEEPFIGLPTAVDEPYNADHDGDTVACWIYTDPETVTKLRMMTPEHIWTYDKRFECPFTFKHEMLYGLYMATVIKATDEVKCFDTFEQAEEAYKNDDIKVNQLIRIANEQTTYGRSKISKIVGVNINEFIEQTRAKFDEKGLGNVLNSKNDYLDAHGINDLNIGAFMLLLMDHPHRVQEYGELQKFAAEVATIVGLGPVPYQELYNLGEEEIEKIIDDDNYDKSLSSTEIAMLKKEKLADLFKKQVRQNMDALPATNIQELQISSGKVKLDKLVQVYCPSINGETNEELTAYLKDSLFDGVSEQSYVSMAEHDRGTLATKQENVPLGGFLQRQLNDLCWNTIYHENEQSPDVEGVWIPGDIAKGRTDVNTGKEFKEAQKGLVKVKSCVTNRIPDVVYGDEIAKYKYTANDMSSIGASFASALTEQIMQSGLAFKHGGSLNGIETQELKSLEYGKITSITDKFITIEGDHKYRYRITSCCILAEGLSEGQDIDQGAVIATRYERTKPDTTMSKLNTLMDTQVAGDLGAPIYKSYSYSVSEGEISYTDDFCVIGSINYPIDDRDLYWLPEGYKVTIGTNLSTGVPHLSKLSKLTNDIGVLYYIFYSFFTSIFKDFNSEPIELVFKNMMDYNFSVKTGLNNRNSLIDRLYYGGSVKNVSNSITDAVAEAIVPVNKEVKEKISLDDAVKLELNKRKLQAKEPTLTVLRQCKESKGSDSYNKDFINLLYEIVNENSETIQDTGVASWDEVRSELIKLNPKYASMTPNQIRNEMNDWINNDVNASALTPYLVMNRNGLNVKIVRTTKSKNPDDTVSSRTPHISLGNSIVAGIILKSLKPE